MQPKTIQKVLVTRPFIVLCDSGSTGTLINKRCLPFGVVEHKGVSKNIRTIQGSFQSSRSVSLEQIKFPEFGNRTINKIEADVFQANHVNYDIILGVDALTTMGLN